MYSTPICTLVFMVFASSLLIGGDQADSITRQLTFFQGELSRKPSALLLLEDKLLFTMRKSRDVGSTSHFDMYLYTYTSEEKPRPIQLVPNQEIKQLSVNDCGNYLLCTSSNGLQVVTFTEEPPKIVTFTLQDPKKMTLQRAHFDKEDYVWTITTSKTSDTQKVLLHKLPSNTSEMLSHNNAFFIFDYPDSYDLDCITPDCSKILFFNAHNKKLLSYSSIHNALYTHDIESEEKKIDSASFSPSGEFLAEHYMDNTLVIWRLNTHSAEDAISMEKIMHLPKSCTLINGLVKVNDMRFADNNSKLILATTKGVMVLDLTTQQIIQTHENIFYAGCISIHPSNLVYSYTYLYVRKYEQEGKPLHKSEYEIATRGLLTRDDTIIEHSASSCTSNAAWR